METINTFEVMKKQTKPAAKTLPVNISLEQTDSNSPEEIKKKKIYAALRIVKVLYDRGKISKTVYNGILNEYKGMVNISDFYWLLGKIKKYFFSNSTFTAISCLTKLFVI